YYLGGFCFGGMVVYEMARLLQEAGQEVALLALIEPSALGNRKSLLVPQPKGMERQGGNVPHTFVGKVRRAGYGLMRRSRRRLMRATKRFKHFVFGLYVATGAPILRKHRDYYLMEFVTGKSRRRYRPDGTFRGQVELFMIKRGRFLNPTLGWDKVSSDGVKMVQFNTDHIGVLKELHVQKVAAALQARLDEVQ
ncbi:hypothetical protein MNBD_CHLOROFLEXI01-1811, partial [hydrothermal vent metagenome]